RAFLGLAPDPAPVTNSACYSPITAKTASWLTALYAYDPGSKRMKPIPGGMGQGPASARNMDEMRQWFSNLMTDSYA
uniref:FCSD flavin-binding domain-containing protein n=1 Tax=Thiobacillus sp. TaxID=924 RepID=UPI0025EA6128